MAGDEFKFGDQRGRVEVRKPRRTKQNIGLRRAQLLVVASPHVAMREALADSAESPAKEPARHRKARPWFLRGQRAPRRFDGGTRTAKMPSKLPFQCHPCAGVGPKRVNGLVRATVC